MANETENGHADLLELLLVLARDKKLIVLGTLGAAVVAAIIVFIMPKSYTATATILPRAPRPTGAALRCRSTKSISVPGRGVPTAHS